MWRLFRFQYPKLLLLVVFSVLAFYLFNVPAVSAWVESLHRMSYIGIFIAGMLFSFGFSTPFAVGFFLTINPQNIGLAALIGGIGAVVSDMFIFRFAHLSFRDEFERLEHTTIVHALAHRLSFKHFTFLNMYLLYFLAGLVIASPLPDELGVTMLAGLSNLKSKIFSVISFVMNGIGIYVMMAIGIALA